jgi:hypothetical protein
VRARAIAAERGGPLDGLFPAVRVHGKEHRIADMTDEDSRQPLTKRPRRPLRKRADAVPGPAPLDPRQALALLEALEAPAGPVETMIEESVSGRYP